MSKDEGFTWGYSYSTPTGLALYLPLPQVSPGAIHIQPLRGWRYSLLACLNKLNSKNYMFNNRLCYLKKQPLKYITP